MTLPRILVIDDQYATEAEMRGSLCFECGLVKIDAATPDSDLERLAESKKAIAGAVFTSGQISHGTSVENSVEEVLTAVDSGWPAVGGWRWALILLDLRFDSTPALNDDDRFGLKILEELVRRWPDREAQTGNSELPIVMLSTIPREDRARDANKAGALAYVEKEELKRQRFQELLDEHGLTGDPSGRLVGGSYALLRVLREARRVAQMRSGNAMILGPQGSGKTSLARYIHKLSSRSDKPFVEYYSTPGAEDLEYANLFGYWYGAHNMAKESARGKAEEAHEGVLFIDEVHNLAKKTQDQLLRFALPDSDGQRLLSRLGIFPSTTDRGSQAKNSVRGKRDPITSDIAVDVLLLSATNKPLDDPSWRAAVVYDESLYRRLATDYMGKPLRFPSLEQRKEDIPILFKHFLEQETKGVGGRTNKDGTKTVDAEVESQLKEYNWPGNVAELQGVARAAARSSRDFPDVFARHLPPFQSALGLGPTTHSETPSPAQPANSLFEAEHVLKNVQVPKSLAELEGRLPSIQKAYGQLVKQVLEVALEEAKAAYGGKDFITPALKRLYPDEIKATWQAYSKLLRLSKLFMADAAPDPDSLLAFAINKAKKNRDPGGSESSEDAGDI